MIWELFKKKEQTQHVKTFTSFKYFFKDKQKNQKKTNTLYEVLGFWNPLQPGQVPGRHRGANFSSCFSLAILSVGCAGQGGSIAPWILI